ncbi:unnamed protein product [Rotaria sp. Silwood2]|nr:unnamed protein product [Rotaria sp. Silwood2]CAF4345205.1 unnamed protein product [Rotaria sp. Silwood2]
MKTGSIEVRNKRFCMSRYNPKDIPLSGQMTQFLLIRISEKHKDKKTLKDLAQSDIEEYFGRFGKILNFQWNNDFEANLKFQHYDIVDQIILNDARHEINGIKIDVEKTQHTQMSNMAGTVKTQFCIHVTNIPLDVTSEELSQIFNIHIADIVIKPGYLPNEHLTSNDQIDSEAWIKNIGSEKLTRDLAIKNSKIKLRGLPIKCDVIHEPIHTFELCRNFKNGLCKYYHKCQFKHIMCNQPENCLDEQCHYGHSKKRLVTLNDKEDDENCEKNFYRLRISNLPTTANKEKLAKLLSIKDEHISRIIFKEDRVENSSSVVAYLIHQRSAKYLRCLIHQWHDKCYSDDLPNKMKCQVEINADFYNWDNKCNPNEYFSTTNYKQPKKSKSLP